MKIGIDARLIHETGVGRYIRNLIANLIEIDQKNNYVVFLPKNSPVSLSFPENRWKTVIVNIPWHSFTEQIVMPILFLRESLDLLHIPYFNIPIFYPRPFVVTLHDLIVYHFDTGKASTLPYPLYKVRRVGYELIHRIGLARAKSIIAVSKSTKDEIIDHYQIPSNKIHVIYEGIDKQVISKKLWQTPVANNYFLYVGNAYPHKNLYLLLDAFGRFLQKIKDDKLLNSEPKLIFVGKDDYFYKRLKLKIQTSAISKNIIFFGDADDKLLMQLYKHARALIAPSLMEGFGFTPLEALANGTPVIVSDISVFHEILGNYPLYFDANDANDLVVKMLFIWKNYDSYRKQLPNSEQLYSQYRWHKTAHETIRCYQDSVNK